MGKENNQTLVSDADREIPTPRAVDSVNLAPALFVYPRVGISQSASGAGNRFNLFLIIALILLSVSQSYCEACFIELMAALAAFKCKDNAPSMWKQAGNLQLQIRKTCMRHLYRFEYCDNSEEKEISK